MSQLYVNNIKIPSELIPKFNKHVNAMYDFNNDNPLKTNTPNESNNITITLPEYKDIFDIKMPNIEDVKTDQEMLELEEIQRNIDVSIAEIYKRSGGYITKDTTVKYDCDKVLLLIYAKYPAIMELKDELTVEQNEYLIDNYPHLLSEKYINGILDEYERTPIRYNDGKIYLESKDRHIINLMYHFDVMVDINNVKVSEEEYLQDYYDYDSDEDPYENIPEPEFAIVPFDSKYVGAAIENNYGYFYEFEYNKNPYGYKPKMTTVRNNKQLINALKRSYTNIYINDNLDISLDSIFSKGLITRNGKKKTIKDMKPHVFKTWAIGPKCRSLDMLFMNYPYHPQIEHWTLPFLLSAKQMFSKSGVIDLSGLHIDGGTDADEMFKDCKKLKRLPNFHNVKYINSMCYGCHNLLSIDDALLNPQELSITTDAFAFCHSLTHVFNNIENEIGHASGMFRGCKNLKSGFINCIIDSSRMCVYSDVFTECPNLESAFNNCKITSKNLCHFDKTFDSCPKLKHALNNCTIVSQRGIIIKNTFKECAQIQKAFNNCRFSSRDVDFDKVFDERSNVQHVFNNCRFDGTINNFRVKLNFTNIFHGNNAMKRAFVNCIFTNNVSSIKFKKTFVGCSKLTHVFIKCTFGATEIEFDDIFVDCDAVRDIFRDTTFTHGGISYNKEELVKYDHIDSIFVGSMDIKE